MAKSSAELSKEFQTAASGFADLVRSLQEGQWTAVTDAEAWSVGTVAHHVGQSLGSTWGVTEAIRTDNVPSVSWDDIHAANAAHAAEFANPDKAETLQLIEQSAVDVAAGIAQLSDDDLERSAVVPAFSEDPLSVRNWIEMVVIGHIGMHQSGIEAATGQ